MPWDVRKKGSRYCVYKKGSSTPVPGGCHATRADAVKHQRALYAGEGKASMKETQMGTNGTTDTTSWSWLSSPLTATTSTNGTITLTFSEEAAEPEERSEEEKPRWQAVLAFTGLPTSDGRYMMPGKIGHRDLPLSLMSQTVTSADGHAGAEVAGNIDNIWEEDRNDLGEGVVAIMGEGNFADNEAGQEALKLVQDQMLRGVSIDFAPEETMFLDRETHEPIEDDDLDLDMLFGGEYLRGFTGEIMGATLVPFPAFGDAHMEVIYEDAPLVASAPRIWAVEGKQLTLVKKQALTAAAAGRAPLTPPRAWFEMPEPDEPTPLTVTDDGQVYGHLALWGQCHAGFEICEVAQRSRSGYAFFHTGALTTAEGDEINVGRITVGQKGAAKGGHASIVLGTQGAMEHYDNTACVGAYVRAIDGKHGIWLSGTVRADCPAEKIIEMKANPPSGDWRYEMKSRCRELIAALCVPVGGFAIPRFEARVASAGHEDVIMALVATGYQPREVPELTRGQKRKMSLLTSRAHEVLEA